MTVSLGLSYAHSTVYPCILLATFVLWNTLLVYPFRVFAVALHEFSHGAAVLLTCGTVLSIGVNRNEGGYIWWGRRCALPPCDARVVASGYIGPAAFGSALLWLATFERGRRAALVGLSVLLVCATTVITRRMRFSALVYLLLSMACVACAAGDAADLLGWTILAIVSATTCSYSIFDVYDDGIRRNVPQSDMAVFARMLRVPPLCVAISWLLICVALPVFTWAAVAVELQ